MSGRMLKRVLREQQAPQAIPEVEETEAGSVQTEEDEEDDGRSQKNTVRNRFDLLEDEGVPSEDGDAEENASTSENAKQASTTDNNTATKAKRKKSKGKKKGKPFGSAAAAAADSLISKDDECVDDLIEKLAISHGDSDSVSESPSQSGVRSVAEILAVDPRHLRAEDELRRIFGSKVINAVERSGEGSGMMGGGRRRQPPRRGSRVMPLKKTLLVTPSEHWPRLEGGLSMECCDTKDGLQFFRYTFSASYMEVQKMYEECVSSHDPNTIAMLVNQHPYHVDSLLALAELYKHMGEFQRSADLLERCLYVLECAWHPWFNPTTGMCRVDFAHDANKPLFYVLFRHMQHLGRRGCHRTALEVCKLLLSLDSDDPLGSLFCIDYFALRAEQYEWLQSFVNVYGKDHSLALLPSFSFSLALSQFHLDAQKSDIISSSKVQLPEVALPDKVSSLSLLQQALMLHPSVLKKIVDKAPIKEDAVWSKILKKPHFSKATSGGPSLEHLINIYVERNYLVWRAPEVQTWLKTAASTVADAAEKSVATKNGGEVANWACVRKEAFPSDQNEYRHLLVSEFSDSTSTLPPEEMQQFGFHGVGQVPDPDNMPPQQLGRIPAVQQIELEGRNALLVFLQSLMPWLDYGVDLRGEDPPPHEDTGTQPDDHALNEEE
ncbi:unnamed protein product [Sphagnum jensenii]|uniref:Transcription factor 25 n=1 Tax=Sphagnum jensenii TaxID=128206 RepID=A0ABP0WGJ2_9BRYO